METVGVGFDTSRAVGGTTGFTLAPGFPGSRKTDAVDAPGGVDADHWSLSVGLLDEADTSEDDDV